MSKKKLSRDEHIARNTIPPDTRPLASVDPLSLTMPEGKPRKVNPGFGPEGPGHKAKQSGRKWQGQP
jgi:hypothetical protein